MTEPLSTVENPIALVLGGGGARGVAHIGVFKVIQEERVPVDMIVGASIGAFGAALLGLDPDWKPALEKTRAFLNSKGFAKYGKGLTDDAAGRGRGQRGERRKRNRTKAFLVKAGALALLLARRSLVAHRKIRAAVEGMLPEATFADTKIPAAFVALDLKTGDDVILREGSLRQAAIASASLAGFFPPKALGGHLLVDPSPVSSVPVDAARALGAAGVIAVDIRSRLKPSDTARSGADVVLRIAAMACERANDSQVERADVVIAPGVGDTYWSDFRDVDAHVDAGERAARKALPEIRVLLKRLGRGKRLGRENT